MEKPKTKQRAMRDMQRKIFAGSTEKLPKYQSRSRLDDGSKSITELDEISKIPHKPHLEKSKSRSRSRGIASNKYYDEYGYAESTILQPEPKSSSSGSGQKVTGLILDHQRSATGNKFFFPQNNKSQTTRKFCVKKNHDMKSEIDFAKKQMEDNTFNFSGRPGIGVVEQLRNFKTKQQSSFMRTERSLAALKKTDVEKTFDDSKQEFQSFLSQININSKPYYQGTLSSRGMNCGKHQKEPSVLASGLETTGYAKTDDKKQSD